MHGCLTLLFLSEIELDNLRDHRIPKYQRLGLRKIANRNFLISVNREYFWLNIVATTRTTPLLFDREFTMGHSLYPSTQPCLPRLWLTRIAFFGFFMGFIPLGHIEAALIAYRNAAQFTSATVGRTTNLVNFDSTAVGTILGRPTVPTPNPPFQQIIFGSTTSIGGNLIVTDGKPAIAAGLKTFSGLNFLGSSAGELITLAANQSFTFTFQTPVSAVGLYIISDGTRNSGEIGIRANGVSAVIDPLNGNEIALSGGGVQSDSFAYFLGLADAVNPGLNLTSVSVFAGTSDVTGFGIDNISTTLTAVPEPSSVLVLSVSASLGFGLRLWRRKTNVEA